MQLSQEQEQRLIDEYQETLECFAASFCAKYNGGTRIDMDDAVQECIIVLLAHIRSVDSADHILPLPFRDMHHALCVHALGYLPLTVPRRTTNFSGVINTVQTANSLEDMIEDGFDVTGGCAGGYEEVDEMESFARFLDDLSDENRRIVQCMMRTKHASAASQVLGIHKSTLSRRLAKLKEKYLNDCKGGTAA